MGSHQFAFWTRCWEIMISSGGFRLGSSQVPFSRTIFFILK